MLGLYRYLIRCKRKVLAYREERTVQLYARSYLEQVLADLQRLSRDSARHLDPATQERIDTLLSCRASWRSLFEMEMLALKLMGREELQVRTQVLAAKFKNQNLTKDNALLIQVDEEIRKGTPETLLAQAIAFQKESQWVFRKAVALDQHLNSMRLFVLLTTLLLLESVGWLYLAAKDHFDPGRFHLDQIAVASIFGLLGAYISICRRARMDEEKNSQTAMPRFVPYQSISSLSAGRVGLFTAQIVGMISAIVMLYLSRSGLISGEIPNPGANPLPGIVLLSFIAGFSERFVPDALDKLAAKTSKPAG
ncbi:hypothetical protein N8I74_04520 [Chitiniphilus purpureus]|uniref:Uncharacterized protein n=1 Tax=Chitiniphilus purpureus TaxID=2981137 RepID=A0ABY6DWR3_9NEIS|nr:hypothetical protein [Chitiniphilus sp. CD1]UXY16288.1 hypothetical protein N8I74_04520 [Chitiniphilus sp. CD1]